MMFLLRNYEHQDQRKRPLLMQKQDKKIISVVLELMWYYFGSFAMVF